MMQIASEKIIDFLLVFIRASIGMTMLPVFGSKNIPATLRIGFIVAFSMIVASFVEINLKDLYSPLMIASEVFAGLLFGIITRSVFIVMEISGQVMSNAMGLSMASVFDPEAGHSTEISRFLWWLSLCIFFITGVHRDVIYVFIKTYEIIPPGSISFKNTGNEFIVFTGKLLKMSLKLSAGILVVMIVNNIIMGFISKFVPQMNVFFVSYPLYIGLGFFIMFVSLPAYIYFCSASFDEMRYELLKFMNLMKV